MKISVLGNGAWGQALAFVARQAGHEVEIWSRSNPIPIKGDAVILAVPAQAVSDVLAQVSLPKPCTVIIAAKGIERGTGKTMAELVSAHTSPKNILVLSGPSFAADVIAGLPTAVTLAGSTLEAARHWGAALSVPHFRIYHSDDVLGVELGGALKNVLAIACGISDGQRLGDSARAALVTRGFAELQRLALKLGARSETLHGLSGLGDLVLTCNSGKSRNFQYGFAVGAGATPQEALVLSKGVVEGAGTAAIAVELARKNDVDVPICEAVHGVIESRVMPADAIAGLLSRPQRAEF